MADDKPYTVVVGVSATSKSVTALRWGRAQAEANHGRLIAVRLWRPANTTGTTSGMSASRTPNVAAEEKEQRTRLAADVAEALGADHSAEVRLVRGSKRRGLLDQAEDADLLVIDAPRSPSMSPMLAQRIIYAASCPVVVMPPSISGQPPSAASRAGKAAANAALKSLGTAGRPGYRPPLRPDSS